MNISWIAVLVAAAGFKIFQAFVFFTAGIERVAGRQGEVERFFQHIFADENGFNRHVGGEFDFIERGKRNP